MRSMPKAPTPAVAALQRAGLQFTLHQYDHDGGPVTGVEAATRLDLDPARVFKTLVVSVPDGLAVAVVPVAERLDLKAAARALGAKRVELADPAVAERRSRSVVGAISPFGFAIPLPTTADRSVETFETVFVSGGRRGLELEVSADVLVSLTRAVIAELVAN
jgi:Cys-tRNA(Pro)/Cys-tRNA(Cys) deacylase